MVYISKNERDEWIPYVEWSKLKYIYWKNRQNIKVYIAMINLETIHYNIEHGFVVWYVIHFIIMQANRVQDMMLVIDAIESVYSENWVPAKLRWTSWLSSQSQYSELIRPSIIHSSKKWKRWMNPSCIMEQVKVHIQEK